VKLTGRVLLLIWAGHSELHKEYLFDTMDRTIEDHALRQAMTAWGQELIDGKGAKRLADNLLNAI